MLKTFSTSLKVQLLLIILSFLVGCGGGGGSSISNSNVAPKANAGANKTVEVNESIIITGSGSDSDGSIASYVWKNGTDILGTTAQLKYIPTVEGIDTLTLTVKDNGGSTATDTMTVVVSASSNNSPLAIAQSLSLNENEVKYITLTGSDIDGSISAYTLITNPINGILTGATPNLTYTPNANYNGTDSFTFNVTDNKQAISTAKTISFNINDLPNLSLYANAQVVRNEGQQITDSKVIISSFDGGVFRKVTSSDYVDTETEFSGLFISDGSINGGWEREEIDYRPEFYGYATDGIFPASAMLGAINDATSVGGGTITLSNARYTSPYQGTYFTVSTLMDTPNMHFQGSILPKYNSELTKLGGGSIIEGSFFYIGDNVTFDRVGIDVGEDWSVTNNYGEPAEGLIAIDRGNAGIGGYTKEGVTRDTVKLGGMSGDIIILSYKTGTAGDESDVHGALFENMDGGGFKSITQRFGGAGVVSKSSNFTIDTIDSGGSYKYNYLVKSEHYSAANDNFVDSITIANIENDILDISENSTFQDGGVVFLAATADSYNNTVGMVKSRGVRNGIYFYALNSNTIYSSGVMSADIKYVQGYSVQTRGNIVNSFVDNLKTDISTRGVHIKDESVNFSMMNPQLSNITQYSYRNSGEGTRLYAPSSFYPAIGHLRIDAGDLQIIGSLTYEGTKRFLTKVGGNIEFLD